MEIKFNCENCQAELIAYYFEGDSTDYIHCDCGKTWVVKKPTEQK